MRLIDADALIEHLKKDPLFSLVEKYGITGVIEVAPTIDPVKHGKCTDESRYFHCSLCDYGVQDVFEGGFGKNDAKTTYVFEKGGEWRYCPNCGARMDE